MSTTQPDLPDGAPAVIVYRLLSDEWDATRVPDHFDSAWLHTGWYTGNPNPEISVTWDGEDAGTPTGYNGIDPSGGGPTALLSGEVNVDVWVVGDRDRTGDVNPKQYAWELRTEVERIARANPNGPAWADLTSMGVGRTRRVPEPDETDIQHRHRIPVFYTRYQGRE